MNFRLFPYHIFLFAAFQILTVYSINVNEVPFKIFFIVLMIALGFAGLIFCVLTLITKEKILSSIIASFCVFFFFLYGRVVDILIENPIFNLPLHRNKFFLPMFSVIALITVLMIFKNKTIRKYLEKINIFSNQFSLGLVFISIITTGVNYDWMKLSEGRFSQDFNDDSITKQNPKLIHEEGLSRPDIYFLIFDSYANHRILNEYYNWNDSSFVNALVSRGFSVDENTRSNYCFTGGSIGATLSMRYIHEDLNYGNKNYYKQNEVLERFKLKGYDIVSNYAGNQSWKQNNSKVSLISEDFVQLIIHISMLRIIENELIVDQLRQDILSMVNGIKNFKKPQNPTFIYLHFIIPHSPFIFQADGSRPEYFESAFTKFEHKVKFVQQLRFSGKQIIDIVDSIRQKDKDGIIIIQADHGFGGDKDMIYLNRNSIAANTNNREKPPPEYLDQRFGILNAISSPLELGIPEHSTPVNLFRYIFNAIFDDQYTFLPNKSYFTLIKKPYLFHDVTNDLDLYKIRDLE